MTAHLPHQRVPGTSRLAAVSIRLGHVLDPLRATLHNGPGWRIGLWVQGCRLKCTKECLNPGFLDPAGGFAFDVEEVLDALLAVAATAAHPVEGVTVLGGEPTEQAEPLARLLAGVREHGLTTMVYSGYTLERLRRSDQPGIDALLDSTDLLVDGPFVPALYDERAAWRGSSNQRLHALSERYDERALAEAFRWQGKGYSIQVRPDGSVSVSGLQSRPAAAVVEGIVHRLGAGVTDG